MAGELRRIKCQILRFEENPKGGQNVFIECSLGKRVWVIERWLNYKRPISFEEFKIDLAKSQMIPKEPKDPMAYVKEKAEQPFEVEFDPDKVVNRLDEENN